MLPLLLWSLLKEGNTIQIKMLMFDQSINQSPSFEAQAEAHAKVAKGLLY